MDQPALASTPSWSALLAAAAHAASVHEGLRGASARQNVSGEPGSQAEVLSLLGKVGSVSGGQSTGSAPHKPAPAAVFPLPETG